MSYDDFKNDILRHWPMNANISTVELRRKNYAAQVRIEQERLELCSRRAVAHDMLDHANRHLVRTLKMTIYGKDHPTQHVIRYPATWWDAVKERFAPAWFRDRYPVRFVVITASLEELYPDIEPLPDHPAVMKFHVHKAFDFPTW